MQDATIIVWGTPASPFVKKVLIALTAHDLTYEIKPVLPSAFNQFLGKVDPTHFVNISPFGRIPVLEIGTLHIPESAAILYYLDKAYTQKLYSSDPAEVAAIIAYERFADYDLANITTRRLFYENWAKPQAFQQAPNSRIVEKALSTDLPPLLEYLETELDNKTYMVANQVTAADIAITVQLWACSQANVPIDSALYPQLDRYYKAMLQHPSIALHLAKRG